MATEQELLQIERDAVELKNNLAELHRQAGSYASAKTTLEQTNERLVTFITKTEALAEETHRLVKVTSEIGSARLQEQIAALEAKQAKRLKIVTVIAAAAVLVGVLQLVIK